jgi:hypothetical protein
MKADRWSAVLLAGLLFAAVLPAAGQTFTFHLGRSEARVTSSQKMAGELAKGIAEARKRFEKDRGTLRKTVGPGNALVYRSKDVAQVIDHAQQDLGQSIGQIGGDKLVPLSAWAANRLQAIEQKLPSARTAALLPGFSTPRAVAVVASLGGLRMPELASLLAGAPRQETVPVGTADGLLDQVGQVINRIFFLASHDDLEVTLWVGSTPEARATFRFWSEGGIRGAGPAPTIIKTNSKKGRIVRGLYDYSAAWAKGSVTQVIGSVTQVIEYPNQAGPAAVQTESERLDLVNGSSFFCCRFNEQYCHHVDDANDCHP